MLSNDDYCHNSVDIPLKPVAVGMAEIYRIDFINVGKLFSRDGLVYTYSCNRTQMMYRQMLQHFPTTMASILSSQSKYQGRSSVVHNGVLIKYEYPIIRAVCCTRDPDTCKRSLSSQGGHTLAPPLRIADPTEPVYEILKGRTMFGSIIIVNQFMLLSCQH